MRPGWLHRGRGTDQVRPRGLALGSALVLAASGAVAAVQGAGYPLVAFDALGGALWVPSQGTGQLALVDGPTAVVAARVAVSAPGGDLEVTQHRGTGFVVDREAGSLLRVDGGTWASSRAVRPIDGAGPELHALVADDALYVVDSRRGLVRALDPRTLAPRGAVQSLAAAGLAGAPVVDDRGELWALERQNGDLLHLAGTVAVAEREAADPATSRLLLVGGRPVVVDVAARVAVRYGPDGRAEARACLETDPGDTSLRVAGSSSGDEVYTVSGATGTLRVSDLGSSRCHVAHPGVVPAGSQIGPPVELAGRVFVPDYTTGQVVIVDVTSGRVVTTPDPLVEPGRPFDLQVHDQFVVYNDRASERAGVLHLDGSVHAVEKYDAGSPLAGLDEPVPDQPAPPPAADDADRPTPPPAADDRPTLPPPPRTERAPGAQAAPPGGAVQPGGTPTRPAPTTPPPTASAAAPLEVTTEGSGTVHVATGGAPTDCRSRCTLTLPVGTTVDLTADPDDGHDPVVWGSACSGAPATCRVTVPAGGTTVTATFAATVPPAVLALDRTDVDLSAGPGTVTLTRTGGTGAEGWTASAVSWVTVSPTSGTFDAGGRATATIAYGPAGRSGAVDGTTADAVTFTLDGGTGEPRGVAVTANRPPGLTPSCSVLPGSQNWGIVVTVEDQDLGAVNVFAAFEPAVPNQPVQLGRNSGSDTWSIQVFLDTPRSASVYATDAAGQTDPVTIPGGCGG